MKKMGWLVVPMMCMLLTGCGKADVNADIDRAVGTTAEESTSEKAEMPGETAAEGDAAEKTSHCNSMNFVVKGDVILCGYGFTEEKDYLYQIDRNTGEILDRLALKKMPDLLVEQDGKLYVHTYSYDYVIEMDEQ